MPGDRLRKTVRKVIARAKSYFSGETRDVRLDDTRFVGLQ